MSSITKPDLVPTQPAPIFSEEPKPHPYSTQEPAPIFSKRNRIPILTLGSGGGTNFFKEEQDPHPCSRFKEKPDPHPYSRLSSRHQFSQRGTGSPSLL